MIRRAASLIGTGSQGYCLAWLKKENANGNETMVIVFEDAGSTPPGLITEEPIANVKFTDGSPAVVPEIE